MEVLQWMAALASDSDAGLDALPGSDSDESVGAAEALDVLDALVEPARPSRNPDRTKVARTVKRALAKRRAKLHGDSDGEPEQYASFTMIPSEKNITVKSALDVSFGKFAHISDTFLCEQLDLSFELLEKIRKTTLFRYVHNRTRAYSELMNTNSPAAHFCISMCIKWDGAGTCISGLRSSHDVDSSCRNSWCFHEDLHYGTPNDVEYCTPAD